MGSYRDEYNQAVDELFNTLRRDPFDDYGLLQDPIPHEYPIPMEPVGWVGEGAIDGGESIIPGTIPAGSFDTTPPAAPTGLTLSSFVSENSDGTTYVNLTIQLIQPADTDLYGSYVEVTGQNDGMEPPNPVWDRPLLLFIAKGATQTTHHNVNGNHQYWARARAVDVQGNYSSYTAVETHTTVRDTTAPPTPEPATLIAGFRGFGAFWTGGDSVDRAFYEMRWAQAASPPDADDGAWTYGQSLTSVVFISGLTENLLYWFEVRSVDMSGNRSGWSTGVSVTPTLIGTTDIAANTITGAMIQAGALDANKISTGTLKIQSGLAAAIEVWTPDPGGVKVIEIRDNGSMKVTDTADSNRYLIIDADGITFTNDGGQTISSALTPDGLNASAITFGESQGGHNLLLNSSFELAGTVPAPSTYIFTDSTRWATADGTRGRVTALVNITEGTTLTATAVTY